MQLCQVYDSAEFCRNVHANPEWQQQAVEAIMLTASKHCIQDPPGDLSLHCITPGINLSICSPCMQSIFRSSTCTKASTVQSCDLCSTTTVYRAMQAQQHPLQHQPTPVIQRCTASSSFADHAWHAIFTCCAALIHGHKCICARWKRHWKPSCQQQLQHKFAKVISQGVRSHFQSGRLTGQSIGGR